MDVPFRAILLRFTNPASQGAIEQLMAEYSFEYVVSVSVNKLVYSEALVKDQHWYSSSDIRGGYYAELDESALLPLDEQLIEGMRGCEAQFMQLVTRLEDARIFSYEERRQLYYRHLRIWNDIIERQFITLCLSGIIPHEIPDLLIYGLCKYKGIATHCFHATTIPDTAVLIEDWEASTVQTEQRYHELQHGNSADITLAPRFEEYYQKQVNPEGTKPITFHRPTITARIIKLVRHSPFLALRSFFSWVQTLFQISAWSKRFSKLRLLQTRNTLKRVYDNLSVEPVLTKKFIYFPLQYQPECSTLPMAGAYRDQLVFLQLLSQCIPDDVHIYVKEHPKQRKKGFANRSINFYKQIAALPNASLVSHDMSSFVLREHCKAVATGTGTAGFEALFRAKPVILFGHRFYQYAAGVYMVRTKTDCIQAIEDIFQAGKTPSLRDIRLYLKALEETTVHASLTDWHQKQASNRTPTEHREAIAKALSQRLRS